MTTLQDRFRGALVGLACGDAVGAPVEFHARGAFEPVTDMDGGNGFAPGEWTDDTAMAICLANSLVEKGFDVEDQMEKYCKWVYLGYVDRKSVAGIGRTVANAVSKYSRYKVALAGDTDPNTSGNGSLMRMAPVPMFRYPDLQRSIVDSAESSKTTHGSLASLESCMLFGEMLFKAFSGQSKEAILFETITPIRHPEIVSIKKGEYRNKQESEIKGSGYVVQSLEASLWCFLKTSNYKDAVLKAANLGDDADTTAAITGQIAGAFYGYSSIPENWKKNINQHDIIVALADKLATGKS